MSPELTEIFEVHREPPLTNPVLVVSLEGWVDAGHGRHHGGGLAPGLRVRPSRW